MLILSRREGETVLIGRDVQLTVLQISSKLVRIGIEAPREVPILREELADRRPIKEFRQRELAVRGDSR